MYFVYALIPNTSLKWLDFERSFSKCKIWVQLALHYYKGDHRSIIISDYVIFSSSRLLITNDYIISLIYLSGYIFLSIYYHKVESL